MTYNEDLITFPLDLVINGIKQKTTLKLNEGRTFDIIDLRHLIQVIKMKSYFVDLELNFFANTAS